MGVWEDPSAWHLGRLRLGAGLPQVSTSSWERREAGAGSWESWLSPSFEHLLGECS